MTVISTIALSPRGKRSAHWGWGDWRTNLQNLLLPGSDTLFRKRNHPWRMRLRLQEQLWTTKFQVCKIGSDIQGCSLGPALDLSSSFGPGFSNYVILGNLLHLISSKLKRGLLHKIYRSFSDTKHPQ